MYFTDGCPDLFLTVNVMIYTSPIANRGKTAFWKRKCNIIFSHITLYLILYIETGLSLK